MAACLGLLALVAVVQHPLADYDASISTSIITSMQMELQLPWMTVDFDAEVIESGAAMQENFTAIDADSLKRALFAGIKAARDDGAVYMHYVGTREGQLYAFYNYGVGEEGAYSVIFSDTNESCIERWNFTRSNAMHCPDDDNPPAYHCQQASVELSESLGYQGSGHCIMGLRIDQETGLLSSDWNDADTFLWGPIYFDPRFRPWYIDAVVAGKKKWSPIYVFGVPPFPVGVTAARPVYAPFTNELVGVAGIDFVLSAIETLMKTFVPDDGTIAYLLDGNSSLMLGSSIAGVATSADGMNDAFHCGIPEIEARSFF